MRSFNAFNIFEIVKRNKKEEYLYMTHEELFQKKLKTDEMIIIYKKDSEKAKQFPFEDFYPDPSAVYRFFLLNRQ